MHGHAGGRDEPQLVLVVAGLSTRFFVALLRACRFRVLGLGRAIRKRRTWVPRHSRTHTPCFFCSKPFQAEQNPENQMREEHLCSLPRNVFISLSGSRKNASSSTQNSCCQCYGPQFPSCSALSSGKVLLAGLSTCMLVHSNAGT